VIQHVGFSRSVGLKSDDAFCEIRQEVSRFAARKQPWQSIKRADFPRHVPCAIGATPTLFPREPGHVKSENQLSQLLGCKMCGQVQYVSPPSPGHRAECVRCGETLLRGQSFPRARTAAFALAALFLYVPANIYPVMIMEYLGRETENTVWAGVKALYHDGMWGVAAIVFCASILVPLLKLIGLLILVSSRGARWQRTRTQIHRLISMIGPWAMLDVFLLAIMVALIRFGSFATVIPGPGVIAFTAVVVLTLLASASFDPQLIWEDKTLEHHPKNPG
jgi:paraquat-inducible protein A